jgi:hypothetical protein
VQLVAGAVADLAGNTNAAASSIFTIDRLGPVGLLADPAPASTIAADPGYVEIQWLDIGLAGLDSASFGTAGVTRDWCEHRPRAGFGRRVGPLLVQ